MTTPEMTWQQLAEVLRRSAGQDDAVSLDDRVLEATFRDLGYDSVALLETIGVIEREHGIALGDAALEIATTPAALLGAVNEQLTTAFRSA